MDDSLSASMKQCPRCKERKPFTSEFFYSNKTKAGGFDPVCKVCVLAKVPSSRSVIVNQDGQRQCKACEQFFPQTSEFFVKKVKGTNGFDSYCKRCRHEYKSAAWIKKHPPKPKEAPDGFKKCTVCLEILPATLEYFHAMASNLDGLRTPCKKCCSAQRAHPRPTKCNKPGFKICTKCLRELPANTEFFHRTTGYKDGLRGKCKECVNAEYRESHSPRKYVNDAPDGYKCCSICRQDLPATHEYFHFYHGERDGLYRECKQCRTQKRKVARLNRLEEARAYERAIRRKNAEYYQRYHQINHERIQERGRANYWKNRERYLQHGKEYRKANPEKQRIRARNRKALLRKAIGTHTDQEIQQQYKNQKGRCYYCRKKVAWGKHHVDHVVPLSREGANDISNLVITCSTCNLKKGSKLPHEFPEGNRLL